jgi:hypothetical protein
MSAALHGHGDGQHDDDHHPEPVPRDRDLPTVSETTLCFFAAGSLAVYFVGLLVLLD